MFGRIGSRVFNGKMGQRMTAQVGRSRKMGTSGAKEGPYSVPKGAAYPNEPYPLGLTPGSKSEGWEAITYACYFGCAVWLIVGLSTKDNDGFKVRPASFAFI